jgi:putative CRISPR-associated protein (TIGR02619 family)
MRDILICTVGTSLLGNLARSEDANLLSLLEKRNEKGLAIALGKIAPEERICGAEINSINGILNQGYLQYQTRLVFLVSDTDDGRFLGQVLKLYYKLAEKPWRFDDVEVSTVEVLTHADAKLFRTKGLRNLVRLIAKTVERYESNRIVINATGGYKAQISFAGMIAQALAIPVCYLFEQFSEVIELPPQPISLDLSFWLENVDIFYDLAADEAHEDPSEREERFGSLVDVEYIEGQKIIGLSAVGQLFHDTFRYRFQQQRDLVLPPDSGILPEKKVIKYEDNNKGKHHGLQQWLEQLKNFPYVKRIESFYYNPDLPMKKYIRKTSTGDVSKLEGGFSDGKATTKFNVVTTAETEGQRDAVLADLNGLL